MLPLVPDVVPNIIQALILVVIFCLVGGKALHKHPWPFYIVAIIAGVLTFVTPVTDIYAAQVVLDILASCYTGVAMYLLVMFAGALPRRWKFTKLLLTMRSELSILAGIIIMAHVFKVAFFVPMSLTPFWILVWKRAFIWMFVASTLVGVPLLICFMIPWITSFPVVRKRLEFWDWKKKQRLAYPFMALLIAQGILLSCGHACYVGTDDAGYVGYVVNGITYAVIGVAYLVLKLVQKRQRAQRKAELQEKAGEQAECVEGVQASAADE